MGRGFDMNFGLQRRGRSGLVSMKKHPMMLLVKSWPKRTEAMKAEFTREAAESTRKDLLQRLPTGALSKAYKKGLKTSEVTGTTRGAKAHALHLEVKASRVNSSDATKTVFDIKQKLGPMRPSKAVLVLQKYNPWTLDTLPFKPSDKVARVLKRSATDREVDRIRKARKRDQPRWRAELAVAGAASLKTKAGTHKEMKAVPDIAHDALREEFSLGGVGGKAHWRPALIKLARKTIPKQASQKGKFDKVMSDPHNKDWLGWPGSSKGKKIPLKYLDRFKGFQDKLGLNMKV